jgi:N-acetylglucosaminyldiphosphoundecaprenol N-acetyl-beta-D-mannosaminyltransferase
LDNIYKITTHFSIIRTQKNHTQPARKFGQILGINVTGTSVTSVLAGVGEFISRSKKFYIVTPNPELILMAQKNQRLKDALNGADLAVPDGVGLRLGLPGINIIKGRELFLELVKLASAKKWKIFLLGGLDNEAELAANKLQTQYPELPIRSFRGPKLDQNAQAVSKNDIKLVHVATEKINRFSPELLFVAFGNPKQEIWVHDNYTKLNIGGAMAVGGVFRYVAGLSKLPPEWMSDAGLEWLWRLVTEPKRLGRILRAVIVFPLKVFLSKF